MNEYTATLDTPGSIAVIGGGPLGIEAALYGRYLGYDVAVFEAKQVGNSFGELRDSELPMLPDRCLSNLAIAALSAQNHETGPQTLPMTYGQWIDQGLVALTQSDLLRGRVNVGQKVTAIETVPIETEEQDDAAESASDSASQPDDTIPDDYRLIVSPDDDRPDHSVQVEAVIVAIGDQDLVPAWDDHLGSTNLGSSHLESEPSNDSMEYFFRLGTEPAGNLESDLQHGYRKIVAIFAGLVGRGDLDLYRPSRL